MDFRLDNQVSRDILIYLDGHYPKAVKFSEMVVNLGVNEKTLFNNLFFLEDNSMIQLMCSYPTGATYPAIHMIKGREEGRTILNDQIKFEDMFPLQSFTHSLDEYKINNLTVLEIISALLTKIKNSETIKSAEKIEIEKTLDSLKKNPLISDIKLGNILENLQQ